MAVVFNRFCLSSSKTLKLGGLAYQYEFELSVHLRNVTRKINHHKYYSLFHHFSIFDLSKLFSFLLGTVRFRACHCKSLQMFFIVSHTDTSQNKFAHTKTYAKYLFSFVNQILPKVLAKEEKEAPKLCFSPPPVLTYWSDKSLPDLKGLFTCFEKDNFFSLFYLSFFLVICNFTIPFTNCCHGK